jgi:hypothetical protein
MSMKRMQRKQRKGSVTASTLNVRPEPSTKKAPVGQLLIPNRFIRSVKIIVNFTQKQNENQNQKKGVLKND